MSQAPRAGFATRIEFQVAKVRIGIPGEFQVAKARIGIPVI